MFVGDLMLTLTGCDKAKWAAKEKYTAKLLGFLQMHKQSLVLFLSINTNGSVQEMQRDMAEFKQLLSSVLQAIPDLAERMATVSVPIYHDSDLRAARAHAPADPDVNVNTIRSWASIFSTETSRSLRRVLFDRRLGQPAMYGERPLLNSSSSTVHTARTGDSNDTDTDTIRSMTSIRTTDAVRSRRFTFDRCLRSTRVYRMSFRNSSSSAIVTEHTLDSAFSQLLGLSLAQISNISVIRLPVYTVELSNGYVYDEAQASAVKDVSIPALSLNRTPASVPKIFAGKDSDSDSTISAFSRSRPLSLGRQSMVPTYRPASASDRRRFSLLSSVFFTWKAPPIDTVSVAYDDELLY
ncbi:hypothetical protein BZA05DRAFT_461959 [Tricharina praecox]|uniref:uncharacterized protein n=1 Tax=Tricharina praecox TaxID=43433 RepID=UPI00221EBF29|nr:uncharacterized protein BZA05DRAFT_461959 [Tricharina praecox]KAI5842785.1 hypothetical protein BZA05DRAFT_461959 [Tricharina praecox]